MTLTRMKNGVEVVLTAQEESATRAEWSANEAKRDGAIAKKNEFDAKRALDVSKLGSRTTLIAEIDSMNSVPQIREVVKKLAEIVYTEAKKTID